MPMYEFLCADCGSVCEHIVAGSDRLSGLSCPGCDAPGSCCGPQGCPGAGGCCMA